MAHERLETGLKWRFVLVMVAAGVGRFARSDFCRRSSTCPACSPRARRWARSSSWATRHHVLYLRAADVPDGVVSAFEAAEEHAGGCGWDKVARQLLGNELATVEGEARSPVENNVSRNVTVHSPLPVLSS